MIAAEHLEKRFIKVHAVNDVSLHAQRGEIFGLLGPNGAGKSTTIRMITSIIQPDSGTITYDGRPFGDAERERLGYLPEERGLYQKARILETLIFFGQLHGLDARTARSRSEEWLRRFDLAGSERRAIEELSKGNQQKLQIIIALLHQPDYVIFDEPASGLDPVNQELLRDIVDELRSANCCIIYSTHQLALAERLCDRIALINKGKVVLEGTIEEVKGGYGGNAVHIEFDGNGEFLREIPQVASADIYPNYAELQLHPDATLNDLFPSLTDRLRVSRIERVRPSLNTIFIETVGHANAPAEMLQQTRLTEGRESR
jgi:ABC-2 type transport system ATP-binding protein